MASQYTIPLHLPADYSRAIFIVSACNEEALQWIDRWQSWPAHALLLVGPKGSGKSHLAHIWQQQSQACILDAKALNPEQAASGHCLLEDIEQVSDESALFHLLNYSREQGHRLLLTSVFAATQLPFTLKDLTSRLLALPAAFIQQADDAALAGAIRKQFADRQIKLDEDVIAYLLPRMERSFERARALVERLDAEALTEQRTLTIPFVKRLLETPGDLL